MEKFRQSLEFVQKLEEDVDTLMKLFNDVGSKGITEMTCSELLASVEDKQGIIKTFAAGSHNVAARYLKSRLGTSFDFGGDHNQWTLLPVSLGDAGFALSPRVLEMIKTVATNMGFQELTLSKSSFANGNRAPINIIVKRSEESTDNPLQKAYYVCEFELIIKKIKHGLIPIKELANKILRNEIQLFDDAKDDAATRYVNLRLLCTVNKETMHMRANAYPVIPKLDTAPQPTKGSNAYSIFGITQNVEKIDKSTNTVPSWLSQHRGYRCPARSNCKRKLEKVKFEVMQIISEAPRGINSRDLYKTYRNRHGNDLRFKNKDFRSPARLIKKLGLMNFVSRPRGDAGDFLFKIPAPVINIVPEVHEEDALIPRGFVQYGETIPALPRDTCRPGQVIIGIVGGIYTPTDFHFVRYGPNYHIALEHVSNEMNSFYNRHGAVPQMQRESVRMDLFCCAKSGESWYRAVIMRVVDDNNIMVVHVDYGTEDVISLQNIRPLRREWAQLPMQAIRGRLHSVCPPATAGDKWPIESVNKFAHLVHSKPLFIQIVAVNNRGTAPIAKVSIIDTSLNRDVIINMALVNMGFASWTRCNYRCVHRLA